MPAVEDSNPQPTRSPMVNWRVQRKHQKRKTSPFCHSVSDHSVVAAWKPSQLDAALSLYDAFLSCSDPGLARHISTALDCLRDAIRLYGTHSVICSFNGGKDAVVVLHLLIAAHAQYYRDYLSLSSSSLSDEATTRETPACPRPRVTYFDHEYEFPQVRELLEQTVDDFDLDMVAFEQGISYQDGLERLVDLNYPPGTHPDTTTATPPHPMAFVLGTRSSDPNAGSQGKFAPSSDYMPNFMRVNPILDWSYGDVWQFLRLYQLPYCSLYDCGYTSLGTTLDTKPCPALAKQVATCEVEEDEEKREYWPAYMLTDYTQERAGRVSKKRRKSTTTPEPKHQTSGTQREKQEGTTSSSAGVSLGENKEVQVGDRSQ